MTEQGKSRPPWEDAWRTNLPDVVILGIVHWDTRWQRPHHFADQLVRRGHRVVYVDPSFTPGRRSWEIQEAVGAPDGVVYVRLSSAELGSIHNDEGFEWADIAHAHHTFWEMYDGLRLRCPIILVQSPAWWPLLDWIARSTDFPLVYDCLDEHRGWSSETGEHLRDLEHRLAERADLVLASSRPLFERCRDLNWNTILVPNGCDAEHFLPANEPTGVIRHLLGGPVIGYFGAISSSWFDTGLVAAAAELRPDWQFVFLGPADEEVRDALAPCANVLLPGSVPYQDLPRYAADFDVGTIPFLVNELTSATDPVKLYEYFAAGKPVVATPMPELYPFQGLTLVADGATEFVAAVERFLEEPGDVEGRRDVAREATWSKRIDLFHDHMLATLPSLDVVIVTYNNAELTRACIDSLAADASYPMRIIVVDNGSIDRTSDILDEIEAIHDGVVIRNSHNEGFARANNQGIAAGNARYVLLLNNDVVVPGGALLAFVGALARSRDFGIVGAVTNRIGNEAQIEVHYEEPARDEVTRFARDLSWSRFGMMFDIAVPALFAAVMRRKDLDAVGGIPDRYAVGMFEDDELAVRMREIGKRTVCSEDVFIHHAGGASFSRLDPVMYRAVFERNLRLFESATGTQWTQHRYREDQSAPVDISATE